MVYSKSEFRKFSAYSLEEDQLDNFEEKLKKDNISQSYNNYKLSEQLAEELFSPGYLEAIAKKKDYVLNNLPVIKENKTGGNIKPLAYGIAAVCLLMIASLLVIKQTKSIPSIEEMIETSSLASLNLDHIATVERGDKQEQYSLAIELFNAKDYKNLIQELNDHNDSDILSLLKARSYFQIGNFAESKEILQQLNTSDFPQRDALLWSLVKVEYELYNIGNTKIHLEEIINSKYPNFKNAEKILHKLLTHERHTKKTN